MQGNKKPTDGQSDSSSIGSLLDDTDREVCSLTDRAFKSLCVAELETSYTESDPIVSSNNPHQFSSKFFQGPWIHTIKKNTDKQLSKTFQQFPNDAPEDLKASANNSPNIRRNLGMPVSGLHDCKHTSKVSSLIKTFDKAENQKSLAMAKQPVKNSLTEYPLIYGGNITFWDGKTILSIQKELSAFSDPCQDVTNTNDWQKIHKRHNKMDLDCQGSHYFCLAQVEASNIPKSKISTVSKKTVKNRTGKAKEPTRKADFLHSENSAFESWNAHYKKLIEMDGSTEIITKDKNLTYFEDIPFFKESCIPEHITFPHKVTVPIVLEQGFSDAFSQKPLSKAILSPVSLAQIHFPVLSKAKNTAVQMLLPQVSDLATSEHRIPTPPSLPSTAPFPPTRISQVVSPIPIPKAPIPQTSVPQVPVPPEAASHSPDTQALVPQVILCPKKTSQSEFKPELENVCPPWRKQKTALGVIELAQDTETEEPKLKDSSGRKPSDVTPLAETATVYSNRASSDPSSPFFNISKLLTPFIPPKQDKQPSENQLLLVTPPLSEVGVTKESDEIKLYCSQNNYKSKAPSLLFNLKDIRKRVKSTYSPSPLLRAIEDKKKIKEQDNIKASVTASDMLGEGSMKLVEDDVRGHKPSEQVDNTQEKDSAIHLNGHLTDNYLTLSSPKSKTDTLNYQNKNGLWQSDLVDVEDCEVVSVTELHQNEHSVSQLLPSSNSYFADVTTEQEVCIERFHLRDPQNKTVALRQTVGAGPQVSPNLFFTAEENMKKNNENQACPLIGHEQKGKRSTSSSEQSFLSITDQPFNEAPFSLMQLFQKACLQESQKRKNGISGEEKLKCKEKEKAERKNELHDYLLNNCDFNTDWKCERKKEQSENKNAVQEIMAKEKKGDRWKNMDSASEAKSEELLIPTSSILFKPNLFMIKDNTFKSSPVIKAVKLPLLRSLSCEDAISGSHVETEKLAYGPIQATPNTQEMDLSLSKIRRPHSAKDAAIDRGAEESGSIPVNVGCQVANKSNSIAGYTLGEGIEGVYMQELVGNYEGTNVTSVLSKTVLKGNGKLAKPKEKARAGKLRSSSASQPNLRFEGDLIENKQQSPTREKSTHFKSNLFSKCKGGSSVKKLISLETSSPMVLENQTCSPASSDAFVDTSAASGNLTSPRSDNMVQSAFTTSLSDTSAKFNISQAEKIAPFPLLHKTESRDKPSAMETFDPIKTSELPGDTGSSPMMNERLQLMGRMAKTASKPPAVPPKTEKTLRRAKKLANRRKKIEAQQKRLQDEPTSPCGDIVPLPPVQSSLSPIGTNSLLTPSESNLVRLQLTPSLSPTPSIPATQRKLLQDPDSGEYFIVDLPIQLKTFYDPESGRYVQVSIPSSKRNLSQTPSSEIPPPHYVLYPSALPLRVSSAPVMASPFQLSEPASFMQGAPSESASDWQPSGQYPASLEGQHCLESALSDVHSQEAEGSQHNSEKDMGLSANADIISMGAIEDFAVEGIL
ncbi:cardiac-enriched FHL2-interacting protein [Elgaria multicarinata webbii]|uniref:cardiac-enriched FHL2-interacting protein n=1 Tax=Elgaria multicarinata webbii TaxID=159646 RepID=UPI002FCD0D72